LKIASKRIVDEMPMVVNTVLIMPVLAGVRKLHNEVSDSQLEKIIVENESIRVKRARLEETANMMQSGVQVLEHVYQG
jgi:hypothetical protein